MYLASEKLQCFVSHFPKSVNPVTVNLVNTLLQSEIGEESNGAAVYLNTNLADQVSCIDSRFDCINYTKATSDIKG
jgi:hypothetical protein